YSTSTFRSADHPLPSPPRLPQDTPPTPHTQIGQPSSTSFFTFLLFESLEIGACCVPYAPVRSFCPAVFWKGQSGLFVRGAIGQKTRRPAQLSGPSVLSFQRGDLLEGGH